VPINTAKKELPELEGGGTLRKAYLGVVALTINGSLSSLNLPVKEGVLVESVQAGTPAAKAGIRGGNVEAKIGGGEVNVGGDIIVGIDGKQIKSAETLTADIESKKPGETISVELLRADGSGSYSKKTFKVVLTQRPSSAPTISPAG
jgi:S1-C subfamily serine protease